MAGIDEPEAPDAEYEMAPTTAFPFDEVVEWRHAKRGTTYRVIAVGRFQSANVVLDMAPCVVYVDPLDLSLPHTVWVRTIAEFLDGRFIAIFR